MPLPTQVFVVRLIDCPSYSAQDIQHFLEPIELVGDTTVEKVELEAITSDGGSMRKPRTRLTYEVKERADG